MNNKPWVVVLLMVLFYSCDPKDKGTDLPGTPTGDTSQISKNLLVKTELTTGTNVNTKIYQYDAQNRLIWYSNTSSDPDFINDTTKVLRDAQGRIQTIIYRTDSTKKFRDPSVDSIVYNVFYNGAATTPAYKLLKYTQYGYKFRDSFVYTPDTQNRIIKEESYFFDRTTKNYVIYGKTDYTYDGNGDMVNDKTIYYDVDSNHTNYTFENTYTYDDKDNRLNLGNDAIVLQMQHGYSGHNLLMKTGSYPLEPQYNYSYSYTYTYNTKDRPLTASVNESVSGTKGTQVYTYQ